MNGDRDAIRFGDLQFPEENRWCMFRYDRLSGVVRLFNREGAQIPTPITQSHVVAATRAVHATLEPLL
jgi:hypothetical protein